MLSIERSRPLLLQSSPTSLSSFLGFCPNSVTAVRMLLSSPSDPCKQSPSVKDILMRFRSEKRMHIHGKTHTPIDVRLIYAYCLNRRVTIGVATSEDFFWRRPENRDAVYRCRDRNAPPDPIVGWGRDPLSCLLYTSPSPRD